MTSCALGCEIELVSTSEVFLVLCRLLLIDFSLHQREKNLKKNRYMYMYN